MRKRKNEARMIKKHGFYGKYSSFLYALCTGRFCLLLKKSLFVLSFLMAMLVRPVVADTPDGYTEYTRFPVMSGTDYMKEKSIYKNAAVANNMLGIESGLVIAEPVYMTVSCPENQYLTNNNTCANCPSDYPKSNGSAEGISQCYKMVTRECTQKACICPDNSSCTCDACDCAGETYAVYHDGSTSGTTIETCDQTVATTTCNAGYYMENGTCLACAKGTYKAAAGNAASCTAASDGYYVSTTAATSQIQCPAGYRDGSNNGRDDITDCYKTVTRGCTQNEGNIPNNCQSVTSWNACACAGGTYNRHVASNGTSEGTAEGTSANETCTKTPSAVTAKSGYYVDGTSCSACPGAYPNSEGGNISAAQCYYTCSPKSVQNASSVTVVSEKVYNNGGSTQACTYNVTCNDGYNVSGNGTANPSCNIITVTCRAGEYLPANSTSCAICPENSYCVGDTFDYSKTVDHGISACSAGLVSPQGTPSAGACGKIMYVDNTKLYLTKEKQTTPALAVKIDGVVYYANTTAGKKPMNKDTSKSLRTKVNGVEYSIHDNTVQGE